MISWESLVSYPKIIRDHDSGVALLLDELQEVHPIVDKGDRYVTLTDWLECGLLLPREYWLAREVISDNL